MTQSSSAEHIVFDRLHKSYPNGVVALSDVSFSVSRGEIFGIIGRSGAGKSTLLRAINMLAPPTRGTVRIDDVNVASLGENDLVALRRRVGMIFQHFNLLSSKTVGDNVGLPLRVAGVKPEAVKQRVRAMLDLVGLREKTDAYPATLSGGQKQRVGIARALVHNPEVLLCDEATSALDPETTQSILELLRDINHKLGLTVVLITHDMAVIRQLCNRVLVLDAGKNVEQGPVWQVFGNPQAVATRALLKPYVHDVPADIAAVLQPEAQCDADLAVLSLRYTGQEGPDGVSLATLAALGPEARLLHGGLDRIDGHAQGSLLISLPARLVRGDAWPALLPADQIKVLGYVPATTR